MKNEEKDRRRREGETTPQRQSRIDEVKSRSAAVRLSIGRNFENAAYNTNHWIAAQIRCESKDLCPKHAKTANKAGLLVEKKIFFFYNAEQEKIV